MLHYMIVYYTIIIITFGRALYFEKGASHQYGAASIPFPSSWTFICDFAVGQNGEPGQRLCYQETMFWQEGQGLPSAHESAGSYGGTVFSIYSCILVSCCYGNSQYIYLKVLFSWRVLPWSILSIHFIFLLFSEHTCKTVCFVKRWEILHEL